MQLKLALVTTNNKAIIHKIPINPKMNLAVP
jgi:hypothetical protein